MMNEIESLAILYLTQADKNPAHRLKIKSLVAVKNENEAT
jgi:hypothetical protein